MWRLTVNRILFLSLAQSLLVALSGCSIAYSSLDEQTALFNACSSDAECDAGAVCRDQLCLSTQVDLTGLILEVHPTGASFGASTSYLLTPPDQTTRGTVPEGVKVPYDAILPEEVSLSEGKVKLDYASECLLPTDNSYPAKITLERVPPFSGFYFGPHVIDSKMGAGAEAYEIKGSVPPGRYNVYIEPVGFLDCDEPPPPPIFYANQVLPETSPIWSLPRPKTLTGDIVPPVDGNLGGWRIDVVDHDNGRVISTNQTLTQEDGAALVKFELSVSWPEDTTISPYVRLRPKDGDSMPSVYWDLFGTLLGASPEKSPLHLSVGNLVTQPRLVELEIQDAFGRGVPASVKIQSSKLLGDVATNASYGIDVPATNAEGVFKTQLPPGTYRFRVTPKPSGAADQDDTIAITDAIIEVPRPGPNESGDQCFCGHVITLARKAILRGQVFTPKGLPFIAAEIITEPSEFTGRSFWNIVHALDPLLPDSARAVAGSRGSFQLNIDPGAASDLSVRPTEETGLPWFVSPRVTPPISDKVEVVDMGQLKLSFPVVFEGTISDPSLRPVSGANVYAWLPVRESMPKNGLAGTVVKIAETKTDDQGRYRLILPAAISE
jgi:hypothetical protein